MADEHTITVNGQPLTWREGMTVRDALDARRFVFKLLVVHVDGRLVKRARYDRTEVPEGATVEVLHLISGG